MKEQLSSSDEQIAAEQFDAQATKAAQRVVDGPTSPDMSAEEYQRGVATYNFQGAVREAERKNDDSSNSDSLIQLYRDEDGVAVLRSETQPVANNGPAAKSTYIVRSLSKIPGSGIDEDASEKAFYLVHDAQELNDTYDTVRHEGANLGLSDTEIRKKAKEISSGTNGNYYYRRKQPIAQSPSKDYNIDGYGIATVRPKGGKRDKPFASQHQEAAKKAIRSLGEKQIRSDLEEHRARVVKEAKETLGRAGIKIPKPYPKEDDQPDISKAS